MLAIWLTAGLIAGQAEAPPIIIDRGDDAATWLRKQSQRHLPPLPKLRAVAKRLEQGKKARIVEARREIAALSIPEIDVRRVVAALDRATSATADYQAIAATIYREIEAAERAFEAKRALEARRRREEDELLAIILQVA